MKRISIIVEGRVQGVGFRWFVQQTARKLGVFGWVKNNSSGSVEILAEGDEATIDEFVKAVKVGPISAKVTNLIVTDEPPLADYRNFRIIH